MDMLWFTSVRKLKRTGYKGSFCFIFNMSGEDSTLEQSDQFQFQKSFGFPDTFEQEQKKFSDAILKFFLLP